MNENPAPGVLLVDDNAVNLQVLQGALEELQCRLFVAKSGEQALKIARKVRPAVILLDIMMPGLDGYETCARLKADDRTRDCIVIFLTALQDTRDKIRGLEVGAVDFITKPFDPDEIHARVVRQLEVHRSHSDLTQRNQELEQRLQTEGGVAPETSEERVTWVRKLIDGGENDRVEFKSTIRWNLRKNCIDKAMEIAWMKTVVAFLNTDGGVLLIGVDDDGNILGTDADQFVNEDKLLLHVNNLIKQHIGLEHANNIRFNLLGVDGKSILPIECRGTLEPVYLRINNAEDFYVRIGPGSRKLSTSEVVAYVSDRRQG